MTTHNHLTTLASRIGLAVVLGLFSVASAMADKTYENRDFRGEYKGSIIEAEWIAVGEFAGKTEYCTSAGTLVADGAGTMEYFLDGYCNIEGTIRNEGPGSGVMTYDVLPNGEVLLYDDPLSEPSVHGVLVDHGGTILLDGTVGPESYLFRQGSFVKQ